MKRDEEKRRAEQAKEDAEREAWFAKRPAILQACAKAIAAKKASALAPLLFPHCAKDDLALAKKHFGALKTADAIVHGLALIELSLHHKQWNGRRTFPGLAKKVLGLDLASILKAEPEAANEQTVVKPAPAKQKKGAAAKTAKPKTAKGKKR